MDSNASLSVEGVIQRATSRGQEVLLVGMVPAVEKILAQLKVLRLVPESNRFRVRLDAFRHVAERTGSGGEETA